MSKSRKYIDIGANLTDAMYRGIYNGNTKHESDLENVLERSWAGGVKKIIITGGSLEDSKKALEIAESDSRLFITIGCHPTRASEFETNSSYLDELSALIKRAASKVVAIGECGLDYDRIQFCSKETQKKYFEAQLSLAKRFDLPLFLHCRNAANDLHEILLSNESKWRGVVHTFDGTLEEAERFIKMGLLIGINGCSLKTPDNLETVAKIPIERILLETDCPWCEIRPSHACYNLISKTNLPNSVKKEKWRPDQMVKNRTEPANINLVLDVVAAIKNENPDFISNIIYQNTIDLFPSLQ